MSFVTDTIEECINNTTGTMELARRVRQVGEDRYCSDRIYFIAYESMGCRFVKEYGTQMYMNFSERHVYQMYNGRPVGPTAFEAFGVYPWCLDVLSHWIHCAVAVIYFIDNVKEDK